MFKLLFFCGSSIGGSLEIIPLVDFLSCVEDIPHDYDINRFNFGTFFHSDLDLVQTEELDDQGISMLLQVLVVVF